jgi:hypothetical protein
MFTEFKKFPTIEDIDVPEPGPGGVLLKVAAPAPATPTWRSSTSSSRIPTTG